MPLTRFKNLQLSKIAEYHVEQFVQLSTPIRLHPLKEAACIIYLRVHLPSEDLEVWLSVLVVAQQREVVNVGGSDQSLHPHPRHQETIAELLMDAELLKRPATKHSGIACGLPCEHRELA